jgi:predicted lipid-binding transport protein (Tim44 family)
MGRWREISIKSRTYLGKLNNQKAFKNISLRSALKAELQKAPGKMRSQLQRMPRRGTGRGNHNRTKIAGRTAPTDRRKDVPLKSLLIALALAVGGAGLAVAPFEAEAKRLGGGRPAGMQRQAPPKPADTPPAAQPGQPANAAAAAPTAAATGAAAMGRRSWMAPLAGLAAGLGIAALLSHFGLGEGFSSIVMLVLLAVAAVLLLRFVMSRLGGRRGSGGLQPAMAGASVGGGSGPLRPIAMPPESRPAAAVPFRAVEGAPGAAAVASAPEGFDAEGFERIAKMIFIRMQAANDAGAVDDLRKFTTPELFASLRVDLQERAAANQHTDVPQLDAQVIATAQEDGQWIVSVRFTGMISEDTGATAQTFAEVWHLVKPVDGSREWAIAGIAPQPAGG